MSDTQEAVHILKLPNELIYMIRESLEPLPYAAFAMTCKFLYSISTSSNGKLPALSNDERMEMLLLLEKSNSSLVLCFVCRKLHRVDSIAPQVDTGGQLRSMIVYSLWPCLLKGQKEIDRYPHIWTSSIMWIYHILTQCKYRPSPVWKLGNNYVYYSIGHQVMKRHLYGNLYGLPVNFLYSRPRTFRSPIPISQQHPSRSPTPSTHNKFIWAHVEARIVDNELYISRKFGIMYSADMFLHSQLGQSLSSFTSARIVGSQSV